MKPTNAALPIVALLALMPAASVSCPAAEASSIQGIKPEIEACVWQEENAEVASISLNGKELITFRAEAGVGAAAEKAEDLAGQIQEMLEEKKVDVNELLPARVGQLAAIQCDGNTVLTFDPGPCASQDKEAPPSGLELSWRVVNGIRTACGAPALPASFLKLPSVASGQQAPAGCFSGHASWYGGKFHGRKTSAGQRYDQDKMTAAHRSLPFGTKLLVMNRKTGDSCVVEINDRGPFVGDRVIDLSRAAARQLNMISSGVALVDCLVLGNE